MTPDVNPFRIGDWVTFINAPSRGPQFVTATDASRVQLLRYGSGNWFFHEHFIISQKPFDEPEAVLEKDPAGLPSNAAGAKLDAGKPRAGLVLDFGLALIEVSKVATYGAEKYSERGWIQVDNGVSRYRDAAMRHLFKGSTEELDADSGLEHEAQVIWNLLAAYELKLRERSHGSQPCPHP